MRKDVRSPLLPGVDTYQVVFTLPDKLSSLALGNRRPRFNLLFLSAWKSLKKVLEDEQACEAAAMLVPRQRRAVFQPGQSLRARQQLPSWLSPAAPMLVTTQSPGCKLTVRPLWQVD